MLTRVHAVVDRPVTNASKLLPLVEVASVTECPDCDDATPAGVFEPTIAMLAVVFEPTPRSQTLKVRDAPAAFVANATNMFAGNVVAAAVVILAAVFATPSGPVCPFANAPAVPLPSMFCLPHPPAVKPVSTFVAVDSISSPCGASVVGS